MLVKQGALTALGYVVGVVIRRTTADEGREELDALINAALLHIGGCWRGEGGREVETKRHNTEPLFLMNTCGIRRCVIGSKMAEDSLNF